MPNPPSVQVVTVASATPLKVQERTGGAWITAHVAKGSSYTPVVGDSVVAVFDGYKYQIVGGKTGATFAGAGQLLVGTGSGTATALSKGTSGQVLTVGGTGSSGLEWQPPLQANPAALLVPTTETVIANATLTKLTHMAATNAKGGITVTGSGAKLPVAGDYMVAGATIWQNSGAGVPAGTYELVLLRNGSQTTILGGCVLTATNYAHNSGSVIARTCSAGDILALAGYQNSGGSQATFGTANHTHLSVALVSR